jgi:magnesium-transporting ATPase (P-type)
VDKTAGSQFLCGTLILQGRGLGLVEKIAGKTKFGKIAELFEDAIGAIIFGNIIFVLVALGICCCRSCFAADFFIEVKKNIILILKRQKP